MKMRSSRSNNEKKTKRYKPTGVQKSSRPYLSKSTKIFFVRYPINSDRRLISISRAQTQKNEIVPRLHHNPMLIKQERLVDCN